MGYRVVDTDAVEPAPDRPCDQRALSEPAGLTQMAVNRFVAEPGEQIPLAYHYHDEQEEAFFVLSGTLHVETPEETYEVGPNDLFAVEPESPQRAFNPEDATEAVDVVAVGAPPSADDVHAYEPEP
ncbi:Mannose-6-phosphate isomerase, cupin superfamily [Halogranum amylolyticum]|uniref:Mannose-6-phosphate isomerase, cupin superfamily n=1 Tax=Halogranum amylolyticum TaxID=660520 RepID=A0A1H8R5E7_9EURY|nr:cupin domain-containing protein [Halogranum amylolyticum]SEO61354.1 Mannose-6-phosphate isomerase, cupin superfamily [Halogranum amylolyticum]